MPVRAHRRLGPVTRARGRDWSSFQRPITRAAMSGLAFGFVRVSNWSGTSMGTDPNFRLDWQQLKAFGLVRGAYWFLIPEGGPSAAEQARFFAQQVKIAGLRADDLLVADSEVDAPGVDEFTLAFLEETGRLTGHPRRLLVTYSNGAVGSKLARTSESFPSLWFAWPPSAPGEEPSASHWAPAKWKNWLFWQNGTSRQSDGEIVDADVFNGSAAELRAFVRGGTVSATGPEKWDNADWTALREQIDRGVLAHIFSGYTKGSSPEEAADITAAHNNLQALITGSVPAADAIASAVVAKLPPAESGGLTAAQVETAVKAVFAQAAT